MLVRERDVHDREHHEDVGLQHDDEDVEDGPAQAEHGGKRRTDQAGRGPHPEQQEDNLACT